MDNIIKYILLFFFYSFAGWCLESLYCSIGEKKLINRGFLTGPLCPIYGVAALVITILIYNPFKNNPLLVFLLGIVFCDIVEYLTSYIMEKLFAARWWDYTYEFINIKGRICLKHSLYWGVISVIFVNVIHPAVDNLYNKLNGEYTGYILAVILLVFAADLINAVKKAMDIRKLQKKLNRFISEFSVELNNIKNGIEDKYAYVYEKVETQSDKIIDIKYQIEDLYSELDKLLSFKISVKTTQKIKKHLANRIFDNRPEFERRTRKKINKLKNIIDDIKSNIYEGEEMH
ncbi:MAG: putative ABC transporter permease [Acutalibacteraceae bacterium]|nr:putative ABC transporter permease [Acutalibacteraceae bacterium]